MDWNDFVLRFNADFENKPARLAKKESIKHDSDIYLIIVTIILFFLAVVCILAGFGAVESGMLRNFLIGGV